MPRVFANDGQQPRTAVSLWLAFAVSINFIIWLGSSSVFANGTAYRRPPRAAPRS